MKIFISADIEGVAGVVSPLQGTPGNPEYERARRLMTDEVDAAVVGAFLGGATEVVVNDSHGSMINLLPEALDPRADLILGKPKPFNMAAGLDRAFDAMFLVGHHGAAGGRGVLAHTTNGFAFRAVRLAGRPLGEPGIYGAYAGTLGVPVALVTGDDRTVEETRPLFPEAEFVAVKTALGHRAARQISPARARTAIRAAAAAAVARCRAMAPFVVPGPFVAEFEMNSPALADLAAVLPPARRLDATTVAFDCADAADAVGWMNALSALSAALR
ncbi:aminopeptidase [Siculibacillus lacustris]|uniref:Aminopeptidase n=1 Tax=Siculibacillus lacustris TaxID=1549641 RepID=A0A4Q9VYH7_9HYPH|nr:M55 family metallopeptidase [Siculibacillus lacustris]TBW41174.1 aminopeptidase [Siculibacillus lacustris]